MPFLLTLVQKSLDKANGHQIGKEGEDQILTFMLLLLNNGKFEIAGRAGPCYSLLRIEGENEQKTRCTCRSLKGGNDPWHRKPSFIN